MEEDERPRDLPSVLSRDVKPNKEPPRPPTMSTTISLDEEVRLYQTNSEREKHESLATLYGIIVALDYVERAYVRDAISASQ